MQWVVCRYRRDASSSMLTHAEVRQLLLEAAAKAELPCDAGRNGVVMGPTLPAGATSEAEQSVLTLRIPQDPDEVRHRMNGHLPAGVQLEQAWVVSSGGAANPALLDEAVYDVLWHGAPPHEELLSRLQAFLAATEVPFIRVREKKTQTLNARALLQDVRLLACRDEAARLVMTVSVGSRGSLRPEEVLHVLGYLPVPGMVRIHRIALLQAAWRSPVRPRRAALWRHPRTGQ